jgi:hypothetical protein
MNAPGLSLRPWTAQNRRGPRSTTTQHAQTLSPHHTHRRSGAACPCRSRVTLTSWGPAKPSPAGRNSPHRYHRRSGHQAANWICPSICPSSGPVVSSSTFELQPLTWGGATGIRTPDLLHAMERRVVHGGPGQVTCDPSELRIRPPGATTVHAGSLRTVTSLVTSVQVSSPQTATGVQVSSPRTVTSRCSQLLQPDRAKLPSSGLRLANFTPQPTQRPGHRQHDGCLVARHRPRAIGCLRSADQGRDLTQGLTASVPLFFPDVQCTTARAARTPSAQPASTPLRLPARVAGCAGLGRAV